MSQNTIDLLNTLVAEVGLTPVVATATKTGASIDLQGMRGAMILFDIGQSGDTLSGSVKWTLKIQESADNSAWSDVAAGDIIGPAANSVVIDDAAEDETVIGFGYAGTKRYIRGVATATGTHTNGTPMGIINMATPLAVPPPSGRAIDVA